MVFLCTRMAKTCCLGCITGRDTILLQRLDINTRAASDLGEVSNVRSRPSWAQPGKTIYLSRTVNGLTNVWIYSLEDRTLNQVTSGPGPDTEPMGDPSGRGVYFVNGKASGALSVYHFNSKQSNDLVSEDATQPDVPRDARRVAYVIMPEPNKSELWVSDLDGSNSIKLVTSDDKFLETLDWSPDGTKFAFMQAVGGQNKVSVIDIDGSHLIQLPWSGAYIGFAVWTADGKALYLSGSEVGDKESER